MKYFIYFSKPAQIRLYHVNCKMWNHGQWFVSNEMLSLEQSADSAAAWTAHVITLNHSSYTDGIIQHSVVHIKMPASPWAPALLIWAGLYCTASSSLSVPPTVQYWQYYWLDWALRNTTKVCTQQAAGIQGCLRSNRTVTQTRIICTDPQKYWNTGCP